MTVKPRRFQAVTSITYDGIGQISRITRPTADGSYFDYARDTARRNFVSGFPNYAFHQLKRLSRCALAIAAAAAVILTRSKAEWRQCV